MKSFLPQKAVLIAEINHRSSHFAVFQELRVELESALPIDFHTVQLITVAMPHLAARYHQNNWNADTTITRNFFLF